MSFMAQYKVDYIRLEVQQYCKYMFLLLRSNSLVFLLPFYWIYRSRLPKMDQTQLIRRPLAIRSVLYAKLVALVSPGRTAIRNALFNLWERALPFDVDFYDNYTCRISFEHIRAAESIYEAAPWFINGKLLNLLKADPTKSISQLDFSRAPFWIQLHDLPGGGMEESDALYYGAMFGEVQTQETVAERRRKWRTFLKVKVMLNVNEPLCPGFELKRDDASISWVGVKYERLEHFCFHCGRLSHREKECRFGKQMCRFPEGRGYSKETRASSTGLRPGFFSKVFIPDAPLYPETVAISSFANRRGAWIEDEDSSCTISVVQQPASTCGHSQVQQEQVSAVVSVMQVFSPRVVSEEDHAAKVLDGLLGGLTISDSTTWAEMKMLQKEHKFPGCEVRRSRCEEW